MVPLLNSTNLLSLALFKAQQQDRFPRIPLWAWILAIFLIVVIVGIIITLKEEEEAEEKQTEAQPVPSTSRPTERVPVARAVEESAEPPVVEAEAAPATEAESIPEAVAETTPMPPAESPAPSPKPRPDNLKRIKGIGPKTETLLKENGITTFAQLAETEVGRLEALLEEAGWGDLVDPATWPEQARELALATKK